MNKPAAGGWTLELMDCENQLLTEIGNPVFKRRDVAQTYRLALQSSERSTINWRRVNEAIVARWSFSALDWIKEQAHSGRCFAPLARKGK